MLNSAFSMRLGPTLSERSHQARPSARIPNQGGAMATLSRDTDPEAERLQIGLLRRMPPWRKMELVTLLTQMWYDLALSGLRQRHPQAGDDELHRRLADQILGTELAVRVYGPLPPEEELRVPDLLERAVREGEE